jgi:hypothetical protein
MPEKTYTGLQGMREIPNGALSSANETYGSRIQKGYVKGPTDLCRQLTYYLVAFN